MAINQFKCVWVCWRQLTQLFIFFLEIRKMPLKLRRRPLNKFEKNQEIKPDLDSDSADSDHDYEMVDSDEMF